MHLAHPTPSFEQVARDLSTPLLRYLTRQVGDASVAEDLRQETLLKIERGLPGFAVDNWYGIVGPAGMPRALAIGIHRDIGAALLQPDVKERLAGLGIVVFTTATPEEFGSYIKSEFQRYAAVVKEAGISAE